MKAFLNNNVYSHIIATLNEQNQVLRDQVSDLHAQIDELALNLKMFDRQRQLELDGNKCNHDI